MRGMNRMLGGLLLACAFALSAGEDKHEHKHEHKAPHNGTLIVLGDHFAHLELVVDPNSGAVTAYVLDGAAEKAIRVKQKSLTMKITKGLDKETKVELQAAENVLTGETVGNTSEFKGMSDVLKGLKKFEAEIGEITVKGKKSKNVKFKFPEGNEHDDHDHDHDHDHKHEKHDKKDEKKK